MAFRDVSYWTPTEVVPKMGGASFMTGLLRGIIERDQQERLLSARRELIAMSTLNSMDVPTFINRANKKRKNTY
jgi:hypothetical protein